MRIPRALSPSAFMLWEKDPQEYVLRYLVDNRPPRMPQPLPASVGSSFDAYVKAELYSALFGAGHNPDYEFEALFESQVEEHNRDESRQMGQHVFDNYVATGAYQDLLDLMQDAKEAPQFEFDSGRVIDGVPIFGIPDCRFVNRDSVHIILDWKVKGYCSKYGASPVKGFALCRDGLDWEERNLTKKQQEKRDNGEKIAGKHSQTHDKPHKLYLPMNFNGLTINSSFLETCAKDWATQLSIYGWLMGEDVGDENVVVCIDEIACKFMDGATPLIRIANHKSRISNEFQNNLFQGMKELWESINIGWIFQDMSKDDSEAVFEMLQIRAKGMQTDGSEEEDWYSQMGRPAYR